METTKSKIESYVSSLKERKEQLLADYPNEPEEIQDVIAAQNMELSMQIKFLEGLSFVDENHYQKMQTELKVIEHQARKQNTDFGNYIADLAKDALVK